MSNTLELDTNIGVTSISEFPRVIRRDLPLAKSGKPRVVSWIGFKIERLSMRPAPQLATSRSASRSRPRSNSA